MGIVLASAVRGDGSDVVAGFLTISYRLAPLMLANDELSLFSVALRDPRDASNNLSAVAEKAPATVPDGWKFSQGLLEVPRCDVAEGISRTVRYIAFFSRQW